MEEVCCYYLARFDYEDAKQVNLITTIAIELSTAVVDFPVQFRIVISIISLTSSDLDSVTIRQVLDSMTKLVEGESQLEDDYKELLSLDQRYSVATVAEEYEFNTLAATLYIQCIRISRMAEDFGNVDVSVLEAKLVKLGVFCYKAGEVDWYL
jgi:hypothetical protein